MLFRSQLCRRRCTGLQIPYGCRFHLLNVKSDKKLVVVKDGEEKIETGLKKFGAMLADHVEVGCGSVLNPGTVIGRNTNIYPLSPVRGCVPANSIYKNKDEIVTKN